VPDTWKTGREISGGGDLVKVYFGVGETGGFEGLCFLRLKLLSPLSSFRRGELRGMAN
jgi:hypothetical protein